LAQLSGGAPAPIGDASAALGAGAAVGDVGPTVTNAARLPQSPQGNRLNGIPQDAIFADMALNDGKNVGDWMYKRGTPDIQVSNGYAYDKNKIGPGFLPGMSISTNGQASLTTIDPKTGQPTISAPAGAVDTYSAYKNADATSADKHELIDVPMGDGTTQKMLKSEAMALLAKAVKPSMPSVGSVQPTPDQLSVIEADAKANGIQNPFVNFKGSPGKTLSKAEEARQVDTAKADVVRDTANLSDSKRFGQMREGIGRAIELLNAGPTASGVGSAVDTGLSAFGKSTKSADLASQLETLSGWLTSNVPRMEGPQSDRDVMNYRIQAGMVGDKTKPVSQRLSAANEVMRLQQKYADLNGYGGDTPAPAPAPASNPTSKPPIAIKGMVRNGFKFLGGDPSKKESWMKVGDNNG
jgi:hypothetical protein